MLMLILCAGCSQKNDEELFYKTQKKIYSIDSYYCEAELTIQGNKSKQTYRVKQWFQKPNRYRVEVVEPASLKGKTTVSDGLRAWISHPEIQEEWMTRDFHNSEEQNLFLGYFI